MSAQGKPLRVVRAFEGYRVGDIIYPTGLFRGELIRRGLCEAVVRDEGETVEVATVVPEERAVTRGAPKGRARRRRRQEAREAQEAKVE